MHEQTKICAKCKQEKTANEFFKDRTKKSGLCSRCKACEQERMKEYHRKYYQQNKDRILTKNKKYRQENLEACRKDKRRYYKEHKLQAIKTVGESRQKKANWFWGNVGAYCRRCGYNKSTVALEMHHLDPAEKEHGRDHFSSWIRKFSLENFKEKVLGCDLLVLCSNCHRELHAGLWSIDDLDECSLLQKMNKNAK